MEERLQKIELRTLLAERQSALVLDAVAMIHARISAFEAIAIEFAAEADLGPADAERLAQAIARKGRKVSAERVMAELARILGRPM